MTPTIRRLALQGKPLAEAQASTKRSGPARRRARPAEPGPGAARCWSPARREAVPDNDVTDRGRRDDGPARPGPRRDLADHGCGRVGRPRRTQRISISVAAPRTGTRWARVDGGRAAAGRPRGGTGQIGLCSLGSARRATRSHTVPPVAVAVVLETGRSRASPEPGRCGRGRVALASLTLAAWSILRLRQPWARGPASRSRRTFTACLALQGRRRRCSLLGDGDEAGSTGAGDVHGLVAGVAHGSRLHAHADLDEERRPSLPGEGC